MLFNSFEYLLFFPLVAIVYFLLPKVSLRIIFLLAASYFFYMCWHPIYVILIIISTLVDYTVARFIGGEKSESKRKFYLIISLFANLGILFYFKYYNFLAENIQAVIELFSNSWEVASHHYLLPVGISFYTFQTLSYTIDVYRRKQPVETNFAKFALYVSFFPQLVAGPIERSTNLLPQFDKLHRFDYDRVRSGLVLVVWGLFKKIVVADNLAIYVDMVFDKPDQYQGLASILATVFFSFQIYCDFSGYTDMAIGSARVLGFKLMENFKGPYCSGSIREFWQRWHISLSTWFRDYVYIPLGGNRVGVARLYVNLGLVFLITGLWHGANWTFLFWGLYHGLFLVIERVGLSNLLSSLPRAIQILYVFLVVSVGWIFFRAGSMEESCTILKNCFAYNHETSFEINIFNKPVQRINFYISLFLLFFISAIHFLEYKLPFVEWLLGKKITLRWLIYVLLILAILLIGNYGEYKEFIYFQF